MKVFEPESLVSNQIKTYFKRISDDLRTAVAIKAKAELLNVTTLSPTQFNVRHNYQ